MTLQNVVRGRDVMMTGALAVLLFVGCVVGCGRKGADRKRRGRQDPASMRGSMAPDGGAHKLTKPVQPVMTPRKPRHPVVQLAKGPADPAAVRCGRDEECGLTKLKDGECCPDLCDKEHFSYRRGFIPRLEAHQRKVCGERYRNCQGALCDGFSGRWRAFCRQGRCTAYHDLGLGKMFATDPDGQGKWRCDRDRDCLRSCSHGAVSKIWYKKVQARIRECEDGCANQTSAAPRCLAGRCVAFDRKGQQVPHCTNKRVPLEKVR